MKFSTQSTETSLFSSEHQCKMFIVCKHYAIDSAYTEQYVHRWVFLACIWYHFVDLCVHDVWCVSQDVKLTEGACQVILDKAGLTGWQLARSRVFLRYYHEQGLQLLLKAMEDSATLIQKIYRGYRARKMLATYIVHSMK